MIVYGRNAVREALRGPRAVHAVWATAARGARAVARGAPRAASRGRRDRAPLRLDATTRASAPRSRAYRYADAAELLARAEPLIVALDEVQDPQNLGAICRTAECAGATGVVIPERRAPRSRRRSARRRRARSSTCAVARVRNLADFLGDAKARRLLVLRRRRRTRRSPTTGPDYRGGVVLVLGAEGKGLRPRVAAACDELVALPLRGRIGSLNVSAAAAALLYEIVQRASGLDSGSITVITAARSG